MDVQIYFLVCDLLLQFRKTAAFNFDEVKFIFPFFCSLCISWLKKSLPTSCSWDYCPMTLLMIYRFSFYSYVYYLFHVKFQVWWEIRVKVLGVFLYGYLVIPIPLLKKYYLLIEYSFLDTFVKNQLTIHVQA